MELGFQRLVEICNGHSPTPSETEEVKFLFALAAQLRKHPHLVYVYLTQVSYKFLSFKILKSRIFLPMLINSLSTKSRLNWPCRYVIFEIVDLTNADGH